MKISNCEICVRKKFTLCNQIMVVDHVEDLIFIIKCSHVAKKIDLIMNVLLSPHQMISSEKASILTR